MKRPSEHLNGIRWRLQAMRRLWGPDAEPDMPFLAPEPFDAKPRGLIESPREGKPVEGELMEVVGWVLFPSEPNSRVEIRLGDKLLGRARLGAERPDLAVISENPFARVAGFSLTVDLSELVDISDDAEIRALALSAGGDRLELDPVAVSFAQENSKPRSKRLSPLPKRTPHATGEGRPRVLIYTHQLNLGGAQLYLMDLIRELHHQENMQLTVVSASDGLLREELEALDIPVHVAGGFPMHEIGGHVGRLEELGEWATGRDFDLVLVNTATGLALPGVELASWLGIPAIWAIHESFPPGLLWGPTDPEVRRAGEAALAGASLVIFEAEATLRMFERRIEPSRGKVIPYGLDLAPIDAARRDFDLASARREAGIPEDAELALCVGTVEPRKAQIPLAQAFSMIAGRHPHAHLAFVGVADDPYSKLLAKFVDEGPWRDRVHLIPVTPDVQPWYGMSDILVCASDIESLPRTVLEAMAWETPVLATNVFGLPELIDDGKTGWLCEPRDMRALADGLDRALGSSPDAREAIGRAARSLVADRHSLERYAGEIAGFIKEAAASQTSTNAAK